ncbi:MAG TPA: Glu/Leu/Phe/Val dehydrogenase, partial [Chroococcales cyanobacterium]
PRQISLGELERLTRRFASDMVNVFDPKKDIPAPDVNTTSREMAWIMDTWSVNHGYAAPGVVTGKPICIGGSLGRNEATARGAVITLLETLKFMGRELKNEKILIQGFGNLGSIAAELLNELGATVVGVNDVDGCIYNEKGLNVPEVLKFAKAKGTVSGYPEANPVSHEDFVTMPCTVFIPAALENSIHDGNVDKVKAEIIIEGANAPITASAEETLLKRGVTVVPDILANSGGVIVSYFEWVQGMSELFWTEKEVNEKLTQLMVRNFGSVANVVKEKKLSFRMAAYALAVGRVAEALSTRGIYP